MDSVILYFPLLLKGCVVTIELGVFSLLFGLLFGIIACACEMSDRKILRWVVSHITLLIRGLPELLVIFFIYFGLTIVLKKLYGHYINVNTFVAGVCALSAIFGAYASQTFRGAFNAIPKTQREAAIAMGFSSMQCFIRILLPQAWRHAMPGLSNLWITILKDTALVSLIGLSDLLYQTQMAVAATLKPFSFYLTAALIYLVLTSITQVILAKINKRVNCYL